MKGVNQICNLGGERLNEVLRNGPNTDSDSNSASESYDFASIDRSNQTGREEQKNIMMQRKNGNIGKRNLGGVKAMAITESTYLDTCESLIDELDYEIAIRPAEEGFFESVKIVAGKIVAWIKKLLANIAQWFNKIFNVKARNQKIHVGMANALKRFAIEWGAEFNKTIPDGAFYYKDENWTKFAESAEEAVKNEESVLQGAYVQNPDNYKRMKLPEEILNFKDSLISVLNDIKKEFHNTPMSTLIAENSVAAIKSLGSALTEYCRLMDMLLESNRDKIGEFEVNPEDIYAEYF